MGSGPLSSMLPGKRHINCYVERTASSYFANTSHLCTCACVHGGNAELMKTQTCDNCSSMRFTLALLHAIAQVRSRAGRTRKAAPEGAPCVEQTFKALHVGQEVDDVLVCVAILPEGDGGCAAHVSISALTWSTNLCVLIRTPSQACETM